MSMWHTIKRLEQFIPFGDVPHQECAMSDTKWEALAREYLTKTPCQDLGLWLEFAAAVEAQVLATILENILNILRRYGVSEKIIAELRKESR